MSFICQVLFLGSNWKTFDYMAQKAFPSPILFPQILVLYQWFLVLFKVHHWYTINEFPSYVHFEQMMQSTIIYEIKTSTVCIHDPNDSLLEDAIRSDVAQV